MNKDPKLTAYIMAENEMDTEDFVEMEEESKRSCDMRFMLNRLLVNQTITDNHNDKETTIQGVLLTDENYICPIYPDNSFCLNPLYISDDNTIHLSMSSIGGSFRKGEINDPEAVARYNKECGPRLIAGRIKTVIRFY